MQFEVYIIKQNLIYQDGVVVSIYLCKEFELKVVWVQFAKISFFWVYLGHHG